MKYTNEAVARLPLEVSVSEQLILNLTCSGTQLNKEKPRMRAYLIREDASVVSGGGLGSVARRVLRRAATAIRYSINNQGNKSIKNWH